MNVTRTGIPDVFIIEPKVLAIIEVSSSKALTKTHLMKYLVER